MRHYFLCWLSTPAFLIACAGVSPDIGEQDAGVGGSFQSVGGATIASTATGGVPSAGGTSSGASHSGGAATGGTSASGGQIATGGASSTGGTNSTGGAPATGGLAATGGAQTGGTPATGGAPATGGLAATGGAQTGGTPATGGSTATGGTTSGIPGWTCDPARYGTSNGCDCGCGIVDTDCYDSTLDPCDNCDIAGSCSVGDSSCAQIDPADNSKCM